MTHDWKTKTAIRDGSSTGRFVVDWEEAEDFLHAAPAPLDDEYAAGYEDAWAALRHGLSKAYTGQDVGAVVADAVKARRQEWHDGYLAGQLEAAPPPLDGLTVIDDHYPDASYEMRRGWEAAIRVLTRAAQEETPRD